MIGYVAIGFLLLMVGGLVAEVWAERKNSGRTERLLTELVRHVMREEAREVFLEHAAEMQESARLINRLFSEETNFVKPGVVQGPPPPEVAALEAYESDSLAMIRQGLVDELGLSGPELDGAMQEVKRTFAENKELGL